MATVRKKILAWDKLMSLVNCELFANIFLANLYIHRYTENLFSICTDCNLLAKFFLVNNFYLYDLPKFFRVQYILARINNGEESIEFELISKMIV